MQKIAIIIPCYNEEKRLDFGALEYLLINTSANLYLANDGSTDRTLARITEFAKNHNTRCFVVNYTTNEGKAQTIYKTVTEILNKHHYDQVGYFDADLSTPATEIKRLVELSVSSGFQFLIGSRVLLLNSGIKRKSYRHVIGRLIITLINLRFKLGIYDTQCGAKIFSSETARQCFSTPFKTSWLFDVEIFIRLRNKNLLQTGIEVPVYNWQDVEGSKLTWRTSFSIIAELYTLSITYKQKS